MGKEAYYFSHDCNARNDEKILMLRAEHGMAGYGIYWALVESMFENEDTMLRHDKVRGLALVLNIDITLLQSVINTCITEKLFTSDKENFWSESLMRRKNKYQEIKKNKSEAGKKGMMKRWGNVENTDTDNTVITETESVITENNKGKEIKERKLSNTSESYSQVFDNLWNRYPRKESKAGAYKKFKTYSKKYGEDKTVKSIERYIKKVQHDEVRFVKKLNNFFNDSFEDFMNEPDEKKPIPKEIRPLTEDEILSKWR